MEKEEELDGRHFQWTQSLVSWQPSSDVPWAPAISNDEIDADAVPFQPRFLLQELTFAPAVSLWEFLVQNGLALFERNLRVRVRHFVDLGGFHLFGVLQLRAEQSRGALLGAPVPAGTGFGQPKKQRIRHRCCAVPVAFLVAGTYLRFLPTPGSPTHPWELPQQNGLLILPIRILATY